MDVNVNDNTTKKRRVYQVAKEFHISNEELIEFLKRQRFKLKNHMALITEEMYQVVTEQFTKDETDVEHDTDFRRRLVEKKAEEEARREAIRHEIDEILERSKGDTFESVELVPRVELIEPKPKRRGKKVSEPKKKPEIEIPEPEKSAETAQEIVIPAEVEGVTAEVADSESDKSMHLLTEEIVETAPKKEIDTKESGGKPKRFLKRLPKTAKKEDVEGKGSDKGREDRQKRKRKKKKHTQDLEYGQELDLLPKKKKKRKKRKSAVKIDEKEIEASIRETLTKMGETTKRKKYKKEKEVEEEVEAVEENVIQTTEYASVAELANLMNVEPSDVITACLSLGLMVSINQRLERDTILMVTDEFGFDVVFLTEYGEEKNEKKEEEKEDPKFLEFRAPVVTIMGHVDHGKTSLLDYIRESNVVAGEYGGITQHIGAYEVTFKNKRITFLDTPGHEAFTAMRARGTQITDIVVLVVAADDSVMPQTIEAINHSRAAGVPIVVAINKIDKQNADVQKIKKELAEQSVLVEDWGGKVQCTLVSAKTGEGIDHLLDSILLEAEILDLTANPNTNAKGVIVEVQMERGRGIVATVLIQRGTLEIGDIFIAGQYNGRVRAMFNEREHTIDKAPPSTPVQVLGFSGMPQAGDIFSVVDTDQEAKEIGLKRQQLRREQGFRQIRRLTLDQISKQIAEGALKELPLIIKADVDGSIEAISDSLQELGTEDVAVRIIHKGVGSINESDVLLAEASRAVIVGFHVRATAQARELANRETVDIRYYKIIYTLVNDVKLALTGLLEPEISEEVVGTIEVREMFKASRIGVIAGCFVVTGKCERSAKIRLIRDGHVVYEGKISSLKRFKEDVREVAAGFECGITLEDFRDIKIGDIIEAYRVVETARSL